MIDIANIKQTPMSRLTASQHFLLGIAGAMQDIREEANRSKIQGFEHRSSLLYLLGRLHGVIYVTSAQLIWSTPDYDEASQYAEAARNEANFLVNDYLAVKP